VLHLPTPLGFQQQPQQGAWPDRAALARLGIVGGFITGGYTPGGLRSPNAITGAPPTFTGVSVGAEFVGFEASPSPFGSAGSFYRDAATTRIVYPTGSPNARSFSLLARIKATAGSIYCRSASDGTGTTLPLWRNGGFDMRINGTDYTAAGTWNLGQWYDIEIVGESGACQLFVDGALVINGGAAAAGTLDSTLAFGAVSGATLSTGELIASYILWANRPLSRTERAEFRRNPWQLFEQPQRIWVPVSAGGGVTGTSATTNAADTSGASGTTTVTGASATTNAADTANASGTTTVTGTLATTNADDTAAASGAVGGDITGSSATTNANDAGAASGTTTIVGASATTNADDASNAAGTTTIVGSSATTNADDTAAASGVAGAITGTSATTNADDTASAEGYPGDEPPAVAVVKRGGSNFVKARKRLAVEYLIEYLTEEEPSAETKRVIAEIKAGRPVPADAKPPSAARSLSVADLAEKIIPRRLMSYQNLIVDAIEPQRVIARAVRIAEEREDEDLLMLL
jgi:hypothetical protein